MTLATKFALLLLLTQGAMARRKGQMLKCCGASKQELSIGCASVEGAGLMSCQRFFRQSEQHQIEPLARHPLPWYTGQKQFSPQNSYTGHLECSLMMSLSKSSCTKMMRRSLRKIVFGLLCELLATSKTCTATIAARFMPEALRKVTLFFGVLSTPRIQTS